MKNNKLLFLLTIVIAAVSCNNQGVTETADLAVPVSVENIKLQSIQQFINTTGTAKATYETVLNSEMAGEYELLKNPATGKPYKLGDRVKKGQVIVRLHDEEYVNQIAIESRKLNLEISQQEYEKQKSLYEKGGVTLRELRNSEVSSINAKYDYENAELQLAKMEVKAPFAGVIVELPYYTPETRVTTNQHMVSLMSYDKMYLEINLPEKNITDIKTGQEAIITNYTIEEDTLTGVVTELSPIISTETRTFSGTIQIDIL